MTTNSTDRLDQHESRLDRIEVAIEALAQSQIRTDERIERLSDELDDVARDAARMIGDLGQQIQSLSNTVAQQGQQAEQDRSQAAIDRAEFRSTVERLLEVLVQQNNGNGHG
jgi:chromosome segregation ATPase